jgi:hypothetical protein
MQSWHRRHVRHALRRVALGGGLMTVFSGTALAQEELDPRLYPKFDLDASAALLVLGETIRIDPDTGAGTEIDAEDVLGVSGTSFQPRAAFRWRPGRRHELEFSFLRAVRSAERTISRDIVFNDTSFTAGLRVNAGLRTSQATLTYRFALRVRPESQIGVGLGIGAIFLRTELDAVAGTTSGGADTTIVPYSSTRELNAPTGSLGLYGRTRLGDQWYGEADLRGLYLKVDNFKAVVGELGAAVRRFFSDKVAAELGYTLGLYTVTLDRPSSESGFLGIDVSGKIKYNVNGFRGGVVFLF